LDLLEELADELYKIREYETAEKVYIKVMETA